MYLKELAKIQDAAHRNPHIPANQSWKKDFDMLETEIKIRQYSLKTLKSYTRWIRNFQTFLKSKSPELINSEDAKA